MLLLLARVRIRREAAIGQRADLKLQNVVDEVEVRVVLAFFLGTSGVERRGWSIGVVVR